MELSSLCPQGMRARFFKMPVGLEPARGRASSGRAASAASRRGRRQASEAGADLRSKYADVPPPLPCDCLRARVPQGCGLASFTRRRGSKLRWNSSCFGSLPAHLGTIPPQLRLVFPHFPMEKRGCLPHFPMEKRGCLAHFPMETPKWPYTNREGWEAICSDSL